MELLDAILSTTYNPTTAILNLRLHYFLITSLKTSGQSADKLLMKNKYLRAGVALVILFVFAACNNATPIITAIDSNSTSQGQKGASRFQVTSGASSEVVTNASGAKYRVNYRVGSAPVYGTQSASGHEASTVIKR
ncbi:MAG: hypothetical protein BroJett040_25680 [Oligoflexia bacterium]|nr:MAG: hypothetical protein BroJett040_25680 [Oligoflexia bacterium]